MNNSSQYHQQPTFQDVERHPLLTARLQSNQSNDKPLILVVDDVADNVQFLAARLRGKGFQVSAASNGNDALRAVELKPPDLILLDVQMPDMDGFEVCRRLKSRKETSPIPVIFLTARTDVEDIVEGLTLGAVDYVTKPFHATELLTRVRNHLELKYAQDLLTAQNRALTALNREKSEFLGIAAHDLKNPLGAVQWIGELLRDNPTMEREHADQVLHTLVETTKRMFGIVQNLLDVNAIEEGRVNLSGEPVNLLVIAADVIAHFEARAKEKGIRLTLSKTLDALSDALVSVNADILMQITENLVSNAVKYSLPNTEVVVHLSTTRDSAGAARVRLEVRDHGPGLSAQDMQKLFGKFVRLSAKPTGNEHSTGLGLFIVKKLVEALHGSVWCVSAKDEGIAGATFVMELPQYREALHKSGLTQDTPNDRDP
jgi:signal transduction histidine kinase